MTVVNRAAKPIVFLQPVDSRRQPFYLLYLRDESDGRTYQWDYHGATCGNVNAIRTESYVTLAPGETTRPNDWAAHVRTAVIPSPGRYELWVAYVLCSLDPNGLPPLGTDVVEPTAERGIYVSNAVHVVQE